MIKKVFSATILIFLFYTHSFSQFQAQEKWVDSVFQTLNQEEKIGQLIMVAAYSGGNAHHLKIIDRFIEKNHVGGILFKEGSPHRQIRLTNRFQEQSKVPLLIAMDIEEGLGMRLDSTIHFPKQMTLGAVQNDSLIYATGAEIARQMKVLGVHLNLGPVTDINNNRNNPVIGMRSFGSDREVVTQKAIAYMKGLEENGVLSCAKHFPGHGDTHQSSHLTLPVIDKTRDRLDSVELYPFRKMIYAGVSAVMTGHIQMPALDNRRNTPASVSPEVVNKILREEMQYNGLVITDALNMRAVTDHFKQGVAEAEALQAGNDMLLMPENISETIRVIKKYLRKGRIPQAQFEKSVKRVLRAKYKAGLHQWEPLNEENISLKLNQPQSKVLSLELFKKGVTVVNNRDSLLPVRILDDKHMASLSIGPSGDFIRYLDKYGKFSHYEINDNEPQLFSQLRSYDLVVASIFETKDHTINITPQTLELLKKLEKETSLIVTVFGSPYSLRSLDQFGHLICAFENNEHTWHIIPAIIFGGTTAMGRVPVAVSDHIEYGKGFTTESLGRLSYTFPEAVAMDSRVLGKIDVIAREAIEDMATPGCQVLVIRDGQIVFEKSYGHYTYDSLQPVDDYTIYDIASITKVMATTQAVMFLEERGHIDLDKKISHYLPELKGTNKEHMIIRDILTHQAGLWPYLPFWKRTMQESLFMSNFYQVYPESGFTYQVSDGLYTSQVMQDSLWNWVKESKVREKTYRKPYDYKYSDMGYYLLQRMIENIINQPMDQFLQQNFYDPMGLTTMSYLPLCQFPLSRIAPTENDVYFRQSLVYGMVHDQGAALCGGIAGHAGLFSNAIDVGKMMQMHLQDGYYGGVRFFQNGTLSRFTEKQYTHNRRGIGWDKPNVGVWNGPTSEYASPKTFGHTGFTGTAAWADPEFNLIYVFLSNRIYPDASNSKLIKNNIRTRIQDLIYESMWSYERAHDSYELKSRNK